MSLVEIIDAPWLEKHINDQSVVILDPRPTVKYLAGHIPRAVNLPVSKILNPNSLALLPEDNLAEIFGEAGIDAASTVVVYDSYDGQNAAMLGWTLEYVGHRKVRILASWLEAWEREGHEVLYRPVKAQARSFRASPNSSVRASLKELVEKRAEKLLDLRSAEEFGGKVATEARTGRLPGAISLPWTRLIGSSDDFLRPKKELEEIVSGARLVSTDRVVAYCTYGPRAAVGYVALQQLGFRSVRVYDGSFHEWVRHGGLPLEGEGLQIQL